MKITKNRLQEIIKEEFGKAMEKKKLMNRLGEIDSELKSIQEVEASGTRKIKGGNASEDGTAVGFGKKFETKGTHLLEDEEVDGDEEGMEAGEAMMDMGDMGDSEEVEMGEFESKFSEIGKAIDAQIGSTEEVSDVDNMGDMGDSEERDSEEVDTEDGDMSGAIEEMISEMMSEDEEEVIDPNAIDEEVVEEQEGDTVVNDANQDTVNDNMDKVGNDNPMADKVYEGTEKKSNILSENLNGRGKGLLTEEMSRMNFLAGTSKNKED